MSRLACSRCGRLAIVLYRMWDDQGVCLACCKAAIGHAEAAMLRARLEQLFGPGSES